MFNVVPLHLMSMGSSWQVIVCGAAKGIVSLNIMIYTRNRMMVFFWSRKCRSFRGCFYGQLGELLIARLNSGKLKSITTKGKSQVGMPL